ncbi:hypothetical protein JW948_08340 [bacterium]|nr:hypothetical protein [bacterium]
MKKSLYFVLLFAVHMTAQDLSDLTLIAHYPLIENNQDITARQDTMRLLNTPFEQGGIYCNGIYYDQPGGCHAVTPSLKAFSFKKFAISADFMVTDPAEASGNPLFVGGEFWRWLTVWFESDSLIGFETNDDFHYTSNVWHTVTATYDTTSGWARCYLDGMLVDESMPLMDHHNDKSVGITHFGMGLTYRGYLKNLKIYTDGGFGLEQDSLALAALYNSTDGPNWSDNSGWLSGPVSDWFGITLHSGRVTNIVLSNNNLSGPLPPEIGNLTALTNLQLGNNHITGNIPPGIGRMTRLGSLELFGNELTGNIPPELFDPADLYNIILSTNALDGSIPSEIGNLSKLYQFAAGNNNLEGPLPAEIGNCPKLAQLYLPQNNISGPIPEELGNCTEMIFIYLDNNELEGGIPLSFGNLTLMTTLSMGNNHLEGSIPDTLGHCTSLRSLGLWDNDFTGVIPSSLGNLPDLQELYVSNNRLEDPIPSSLLNVTTLQTLSVNGNGFADLPDFSGLPNMSRLFASHNKLTFEDIEPNLGIGEFDYISQDSVGEAQLLTANPGTSLSLSVTVGGTQNLYQWFRNGNLIPGALETAYPINSVTVQDSGTYHCNISNTLATELILTSRPIHVRVEGTSPDLVRDSLALVALYNSTDGPNWTDNTNWLTGPLSSWKGVTVDNYRVTQLALSQNNLSGGIPEDVGQLTALQVLDFRQNSLTGAIPSSVVNLTELVSLNLGENQLTGHIPENLSALIHLERLLLYKNQLEGDIPASLWTLTQLTEIWLGDNNLTGSIPPAIGSFAGLKWLHMQNNQLTGPLPSEINNLTQLTNVYLRSLLSKIGFL